MSIIIEINNGQLTRTTTAGKESSGNIAFMGGSLYIPNLDSKYKDGTYEVLRCEGGYNQKYGINARSVLEGKISQGK